MSLPRDPNEYLPLTGYRATAPTGKVMHYIIAQQNVSVNARYQARCGKRGFFTGRIDKSKLRPCSGCFPPKTAPVA